jgi:ABC-type transport system involved in cytochrome c biogenesis ATPase subunit
VTLSGANGSGKTTLCRMLSGLHPLPAGAVFFNDCDLAVLAPAQRPFLHLRQEPRGNLVATTALEDLRLWVDGCSGSTAFPTTGFERLSTASDWPKRRSVPPGY